MRVRVRVRVRHAGGARLHVRGRADVRHDLREEVAPGRHLGALAALARQGDSAADQQRGETHLGRARAHLGLGLGPT